MKGQPTEWDKIFANNMTNKKLISKIYKQLIQHDINKKKTNHKMGRRPEQTFCQRRCADGQQAHDKMINITNHQRNAHQNHNEKSPHTCQKIYK